MGGAGSGKHDFSFGLEGLPPLFWAAMVGRHTFSHSTMSNRSFRVVGGRPPRGSKIDFPLFTSFKVAMLFVDTPPSSRATFFFPPVQSSFGGLKSFPFLCFWHLGGVPPFDGTPFFFAHFSPS